MKTKSMNSVMISGIQGEDDIRDYFLEITDGRSVSLVLLIHPLHFSLIMALLRRQYAKNAK